VLTLGDGGLSASERLVESLKGKGPFTIFAPTDEAFAKLPKGIVDALLKDKKRLTTLLTYHVVPKSVGSADVAKFETATLESVEGSPIALRMADGSVLLNKSSKVTQADIPCRNGVVHVIDTVLLPPLFTGEADKALIVGFCESDFTKDIWAEVDAAKWEKAQQRNKEYLATLEKLGEITPKLGAKESWDTQIKFLVKANALIEERIAAKDALGVKQGTGRLRAQCFACHLKHKAR
jgi:hypothetical protein